MKSPQLKVVRSYFSCQTALAVRSKLAAKESPTLQRQKKRKAPLLPYDVILIIVDLLDERSTARLVQTCQHFRDLIEPVLYRRIQVFRSDEEETSDTLKGHLLHRTLAKRPDLLPLVRTYHGPLRPNVLALQRVVHDEQPTQRKSHWFKAKAETQHPPEKVPTSQEVIKTANAIFRGMINLRDVHFTDQISFSTIEVLGYLKNLEKLALNIGGYSPYLVSALRTQPRLKHLELLQAERHVRFQSTDVQELRSLKARLVEASEFVPGRPIEKLELLDSWTCWSYSRGVSENLFKDLTRSACEITDFTIRFVCSCNDETVTRYLQLVAPREKAISDPLKSLLLYRTLAERPDLLPAVRSYHGPLVPNLEALQHVVRDDEATKWKPRWFRMKGTQHEPSRRAPTWEEALEIAKTIFRGTVNITDLHFTDTIAYATIGILESLKNIEKLALSAGGSSQYLVPALQTQPRLKHLELLSAGSELRLQSTDLPELRSLKATLSEASKVVPGRPVETLELLHYLTYRSYDRRHAPDLIKLLAQSACEITDFTIWFRGHCHKKIVGRYMQLVARYLPKIERLCISFHYGLSDSLLLQKLPAFTALRYLKLIAAITRKKKYATTVVNETQQLQDGTPQYCPADFGHFVRRLEEHCPGLIEVEWCRSETFHCRAEGEIPFRYRAIE